MNMYRSKQLICRGCLNPLGINRLSDRYHDRKCIIKYFTNVKQKKKEYLEVMAFLNKQIYIFEKDLK